MLALVRRVFDELPGPGNYVVAKHGMSLGIGTSHGIGSATAYKGAPSNCSIEFLCITASRPVYMVTEDFIFDPGITTDVFSTIALNNNNIVLPSSCGTKGPSIIVDVLGRSHMMAMTVRLCSTLSVNACTNSSEHQFRLSWCGAVLIQAQKMLAIEFMNSAATMVYMATEVAALIMRCWRTMYRTSEPFAARVEQAVLIDLGLNVSGDAVAALHLFIAKPGPGISAGVCKTLLDTYFEHGLHAAVRMVFQEMPLRDSVTYKAMMMESSWEGLHSEALELFVVLHHASLGTSQFMFSSEKNLMPILFDTGPSEIVGHGFKLEAVESNSRSSVHISMCSVQVVEFCASGGVISIYPWPPPECKIAELHIYVHHLQDWSWSMFMVNCLCSAPWECKKH
jgi:hypothetical protein